MKVSIITVVRNAQDTIVSAIESVLSQSYPNIEYIIVDGQSTDNTIHLINNYIDSIDQFITEPDSGIYDAMNKGIQRATGDVIGLLNADDVFNDHSVIQQIAEHHSDDELDAVYANIVYVKKNSLDAVVRYWQSMAHQPGLCFTGWMPAHPTLYLKRRLFDKVGYYRTDLKYQSDLEFCTRLFELHQINSRYIPSLWVRMRLGGVTNSSLKSIVKGNWESYLALRELGLKRHPILFFVIKFWPKLRQFFSKPAI